MGGRYASSAAGKSVPRYQAILALSVLDNKNNENSTHLMTGDVNSLNLCREIFLR